MSLVKVVADLTNLKYECNMSNCEVNSIVAFMKEICPNNNDMAGNYYEINKLLVGLELLHRKINVFPTIVCYFERMIKAWIVAQYVMKVDL